MLLDTAVIGGGMAIAVLGGYALYKLITIGSVLLVVKYAIEKLYLLIMKRIEQGPAEIVNKTELHVDKHIIRHDATPEHFLGLLAVIRNLDVNNSQYIHDRDVLKAIDIINKYRKSDEFKQKFTTSS